MVMQTVTQPVTANVIPGAGVPKLWSTVISDVEAIASVELATLLQSFLIEKADTQWGIFDRKNNPVVTSGRVRAVEINKEYGISTAPQENGGFAAYNKVAQPRRIRVEFLCDGSSISFGNFSAISGLLSSFGIAGQSSEQKMRSEFTKCLDAVVSDLNLYHVTTPEQTYLNMNVIGYQMAREAHRGITLLRADVFMQEVRHGAKRAIASDATPAGAVQQNSGNVQLQASTVNAAGAQ